MRSSKFLFRFAPSGLGLSRVNSLRRTAFFMRFLSPKMGLESLFRAVFVPFFDRVWGLFYAHRRSFAVVGFLSPYV